MSFLRKFLARDSRVLLYQTHQRVKSFFFFFLRVVEVASNLLLTSPVIQPRLMMTTTMMLWQLEEITTRMELQVVLAVQLWALAAEWRKKKKEL